MNLRSFENVIYPTFEACCRARGLLVDDSEWRQTLSEAATTSFPRQLRELFVIILAMCDPSNPIDLWDEFKHFMIEDYTNLGMYTRAAENHALKYIDESLSMNHGRSLANFNLRYVDLIFLHYITKFITEIKTHARRLYAVTGT